MDIFFVCREYDALMSTRKAASLQAKVVDIDRKLQAVALKLEQQDLKVLRLERQLARV